MDLLHAFSTEGRPACRKRPLGFTLIEMLVVIAIAGILLAVAVPAMQQFLAEQAAAASAEELAEGLRLARTEAMKRGIDVTICASSNTNLAAPTCSNLANDGWIAGWIVEDLNGNLIRVQNAMRAISAVQTGEATVSFRANGLPTTTAQFELTPTGDSGTSRIRTLSLSQQGKVKIVKGGGT